MADSLKASFDSSEWDRFFEKMTGPVRESLARRMGVEGGTILRDEAKQLAPVGRAEAKYFRQFGGSLTPGLLKSAIYLAFSSTRSTTDVFTYHISWNAKKAPHGHLVEFGHWMPYLVVFSKGYGWKTFTNQPMAGKKVAATPFLRPAYEGSLGRVHVAMIERGKRELPELLGSIT